MNTVWYGLAVVLLAGSGVKLIDIFGLPKSKRSDIATEIRDELRQENIVLKREAGDASDEIVFWKRMYFRCVELLVKSGINIPDSLFDAYRKDPTTPDIENPSK